MSCSFPRSCCTLKCKCGVQFLSSRNGDLIGFSNALPKMDIGILIRRSKRTNFIQICSLKYRAEISLAEKLRFYVFWARRGRTEITPYIGYEKYISPKEYDFELFMSQKGIDFDHIKCETECFSLWLDIEYLVCKAAIIFALTWTNLLPFSNVYAHEAFFWFAAMPMPE